MWVRMAEQTGTFLAVSPVGQTPVFSLTLQPGVSAVPCRAVPWKGCSEEQQRILVHWSRRLAGRSRERIAGTKTVTPT